MRIKFVYTLVSRNEDVYLEELFASLYSLRLFHKEAVVEVLTDDLTAERIRQNGELFQMITTLQEVDVPEEYTLVQRSREIKTRVRQLVNGDYLFLDTDTIVAKPLDDVDLWQGDILAVPDFHVLFKKMSVYNYIVKDVLRIFQTDVSDSPYWFNSGVMFVKDNDFTHRFYEAWHENWKFSCFQKHNHTDQRALVKTDKDFGYIIRRMPDVFNCQMAVSMQYFYEAKIVHFWHMDFLKPQDYCPFLSLEIYRHIKTNGIDAYAADMIKHCKSAFTTPSMVVGEKQMNFLFSGAGVTISHLCIQSKRWKRFFNWISKYIHYIDKLSKCLSR